MFFERCAAERPDLIQRSRRDISYFDMCFDPQVEAWSDVEGSDVVRKLKLDRQQKANHRPRYHSTVPESAEGKTTC
jgi:lipocalin